MSFYGRTILGLPGKIGNANTETSYESRRFFAPASVHRTLADGATILDLPVKIGNASPKKSLDSNVGVFLPINGVNL